VAGVKPTLAVDLNGVVLPMPVLAASGCLGTGRDGGGLVDLHRLGGVVTRSLTLHPGKGTSTPRMAETAAGLLTSVGLQNPGVEGFISDDLPRLVKAGVPVIASVAGSSLEEYIRVTSLLHTQPGIVALEVYLSAPDEERGGGRPFYSRMERILEVVGSVARLSRLPVFVKLPALLPHLEETAGACVRSGAHGLTLIDGVPAMSVDTTRMRASLSTVLGGLSGPAIRPIALAAVYRVAQAMPDVPIMGVGGIGTGDDAVEFLLAGAWAVQVGTAMFVNPSAPAEIVQGIHLHLKTKGFASAAELRGRLRSNENEQAQTTGTGEEST
jgi:dihydroorotate dehydrogenase (NAD+) catalytic subunit